MRFLSDSRHAAVVVFEQLAMSIGLGWLVMTILGLVAWFDEPMARLINIGAIGVGTMLVIASCAIEVINSLQNPYRAKRTAEVTLIILMTVTVLLGGAAIFAVAQGVLVLAEAFLVATTIAAFVLTFTVLRRY